MKPMTLTRCGVDEINRPEGQAPPLALNRNRMIMGADKQP